MSDLVLCSIVGMLPTLLFDSTARPEPEMKVLQVCVVGLERMSHLHPLEHWKHVMSL